MRALGSWCQNQPVSRRALPRYDTVKYMLNTVNRYREAQCSHFAASQLSLITTDTKLWQQSGGSKQMIVRMPTGHDLFLTQYADLRGSELQQATKDSHKRRDQRRSKQGNKMPQQHWSRSFTASLCLCYLQARLSSDSRTGRGSAGSIGRDLPNSCTHDLRMTWSKTRQPASGLAQAVYIISLSIYLPIYLSTYLSIYLSIYLSLYLSNQIWSNLI